MQNKVNNIGISDIFMANGISFASSPNSNPEQ